MNILITGASRGIGAATFALLQSTGHNVAGHSTRGDERLIAGDLADPAAPRKLWDAALDRLGGRIDVLVNNAGIRYVKPFLELTEDEWRKTLDVNLTGQFLCCRAVAPHMLKAGRGKIINLSSVAGQFGRPQRLAYCASKGGAIAFTKALAVELAGKNICVNALAPALIDTPLNATYANDDALADTWKNELLIRRWGRPEDVAAAAIYLASDESDFVTGTVLTVDGGWTAALIRANEME